MQHFPKPQHEIAHLQQSRSMIMISTIAILMFSFICISYWRHFSSSYSTLELQKKDASLTNHKHTYDEIKASLDDYSAMLRSVAKSTSVINQRLDKTRRSIREKVGVPLLVHVAETLDSSQMSKEEFMEGWGISNAVNVQQQLPVETDPSEVKRRKEAAENTFVQAKKAELSEYAARIVSDVRASTSNARELVENYVASVAAEKHGNPSRGSYEWKGGYGEIKELGPGDVRSNNKNENVRQDVPEWGRGEEVDIEDRRDNRVQPPNYNDYVIPRRDQQFAPTKNPNLDNNDPLAKFGGGVVRQPGDQFIDYDNDFYQGVVNDRPGPPLPTFPDPLNDIIDSDERNDRRADAIVEAFKHSWKAYRSFAWGCDELKPRSRSCKNWNENNEDSAHGFGLSVLDGVTTAFLMGLEDEVSDALKYIKTSLNFRIDVDGSLFETNIRALGSLISLYELTDEKYQYLLDKAVEIADTLLFAFNTSTGIPHSTVNFRTKRHYGSPWGGGNAILSEFGSVQLEFRTLSLHTANPIYDMKATHIMSIIEAKAPDDLLCPLYLSNRRLTWAVDHISLGALGDSFYEYIIKQYLLTGNTEKRYAKLSVKMAKGISKLLFRSYPSNMLYVAEHRAKSFHHKMDHLACFAGGMFALLSSELPDLTEDEAAHILKLAGDITETCVKMYTMQATGVSPEYVEFPAGGDFVNGQGFYILRPETIESVFYMYRYTHDPKWREYGWAMFRAINRYCKVPHGGYVGIREVNVPDPPQDNLMQSFWLAETLKYFYLLFSEDKVLDLNEWVLNTEAHPLRRRTRDPMDVWRDFESLHGEVPWFPPPLQGVRPIETVKMMEMRRDGLAHYEEMGKDPLGGDGEEGMPEDEGLPFDESTGMRGVPRDRKTMKDTLLDIGRSINVENVRRNGQRV